MSLSVLAHWLTSPAVGFVGRGIKSALWPLSMATLVRALAWWPPTRINLVPTPIPLATILTVLNLSSSPMPSLLLISVAIRYKSSASSSSVSASAAAGRETSPPTLHVLYLVPAILAGRLNLSTGGAATRSTHLRSNILMVALAERGRKSPTAPTLSRSACQWHISKTDLIVA